MNKITENIPWNSDVKIKYTTEEMNKEKITFMKSLTGNFKERCFLMKNIPIMKKIKFDTI